MAPGWRSRSLRTNTAANFASQFLVPAVSLLLVPVYLRYLGLAGYGLVALLASVLAFSGIFTRGLGWALQREVARAESAGDTSRLGSLMRTFELGYWGVGAVLGAVLAAASQPLSRMLESNSVDTSVVRVCLLILAVRLAALFPSSVYQATLLGSRHQLLLNVINSVVLLVVATSTVVAVVITRSVIALYVTDLAISAVALVVLRRYGWRATQAQRGARLMTRPELRSLARMSAGLAWTQAVGMLTRQLDRLVVGAVTSLASLGVYSAGIAVGRLLSLSYNPYLTAVFPESCAIARDRPEHLSDHLIRNTRVVALTSFGVGVPLALCGEEVLTVWLGPGRVVDDGYPVLVVYVVGSMLLALADTIYQVHTAAGSTRSGVLVNTAAAVWLPLLMLGLVTQVGIIGAAITWTVYAATTWLWFIAFTYRVLLPGSMHPYLKAVSWPVLAVTGLNCLAVVLWRAALPGDAWMLLAAMVPTSLAIVTAVAVRVVGREPLAALIKSGR